MKELTIEQKAQRYDEAIEKAKELYSDAQIGIVFKANLEKLFTELRESEGEKVIEHIKKAVIYYWSDEPLDEILAWLEKQGEQKPTEWSKEDEEHVNSLLKRLEGLCRKEFAMTRFAINEDEDWLKDLKERYTWKPSEEQMDALYTYIYNPQYFSSPDPRMELVESVYQDLKKLRKE